MPEEEKIPISTFPDASAINGEDVITGLHDNVNSNFKMSGILAWLVNAVRSAFVPVGRTVNNKSLSSDIALTASDVNAQPIITANGILKGDGAGGVSAATAGTDYQTPLTAGTDYATPGMIPTTPADIGALPADGTAVNAGTLAVSHTITGDVGWYRFFEETVSAGVSRNYIFLITDTYTSKDGIIGIFINRNSGGTTTVVVRVLDGAIPASSARWEYSDKLYLYIQKESNTSGRIQVRVLSNTARTGNPIDLSTLWKNEAVSEPTGANNATADVLQYTAQVVSAGTNQQILSISNTSITEDHVLARIEFADPKYITEPYSWTTADGSFTLTGTATAATTANILLVRKEN